jgi:hypothetical protein
LTLILVSKFKLQPKDSECKHPEDINSVEDETSKQLIKNKNRWCKSEEG